MNDGAVDRGRLDHLLENIRKQLRRNGLMARSRLPILVQMFRNYLLTGITGCIPSRDILCKLILHLCLHRGLTSLF